MTLEDEKRLVAEKLMGWDSREYDLNGFHHLLETWNPQSDELTTFKDWAEIFDKMDFCQKLHFGQILIKLVGINMYDFDGDDMVTVLSIKYSLRWEALITMIKERQQ